MTNTEDPITETTATSTSVPLATASEPAAEHATERRNADTDLADVQAAAEHAARYLRLGYGGLEIEHPDEEFPGDVAPEQHVTDALDTLHR